MPNDYTTLITAPLTWLQPKDSMILNNIHFGCGAFSDSFGYTRTVANGGTGSQTAVIMGYVGENVNADPLLIFETTSAYSVSSPVRTMVGFIDCPYGEIGNTSPDAVLTDVLYDVLAVEWVKSTKADIWHGSKRVTYSGNIYYLHNLCKNPSFIFGGLNKWTAQLSATAGNSPYDGGGHVNLVDTGGVFQDVITSLLSKVFVSSMLAIDFWTAGNIGFGAYDYGTSDSLISNNLGTLSAYTRKSIEKTLSDGVTGIRIRCWGAGGSDFDGRADAFLVIDKSVDFEALGAGNEPTTVQIEEILTALMT